MTVRFPEKILFSVVRYLLYPLLAAITVGFLYYSLSEPINKLPAAGTAYIGLMMLIMILIELLFPLRDRWKTTRASFWRRDLPFLIIASLSLKATNYAMAFIVDNPTFINIPTKIHISFLTDLVLAILVTDFFTYWIHRACHENKSKLGKFLWHVHMPHHLPQQVYFLMQSVTHPINIFIVRSAFALPLFLLGFSPSVVFSASIITTLQGFVSHFNVDIRVGWLNYILVGTELHRQHHSSNSVEAKNFGLVVSIWDQLFGTFYYRPNEIPENLGLSETGQYPKDTQIVAIFTYPFMPHAQLSQTEIN